MTTLAQLSAMGTTAGAAAAEVSKGPAPGTNLPGSGPAAPQAPPPNAARQPPPQFNSGPPAGDMPARPVIKHHASTRSVGTHGARSPHKRKNVAHGMTKT